MYALCDVQTQRRAAERWKDDDKTPRKLLLCGVSALVKAECFTNGTHTLDEVDLPGFSIYKSLKGLDCKLPGFVFHNHSTKDKNQKYITSMKNRFCLLNI